MLYFIYKAFEVTRLRSAVGGVLQSAATGANKILRVGCVMALLGGASTTADAGIMKGVDVTSFGYDAYGDPSSDAVLTRVAADHANWVAITSLLPVNRSTDTFIAVKTTDIYNTSPNSKMAHAVAYARALGLHVSLKLQPVDSATGQVLQTLSYAPKNTKQFFSTYQSIVLQYSSFAQAQGVEMMVVGTELGALITGPSNRNYFVQMIAAVRKNFKGKLTYAATAAQLPSYHYATNASGCTWCLEADEIHWLSFWDQLDYTGIDAYPMLSTAAEPSTSDLVNAMYSAPDLIEHTSQTFNQVAYWASEVARIGKPAVLTETGAPSASNAAFCTGCGAPAGALVDEGLQARIETAMLQVFQANEGVLRLAGIFLFNNNAYVMSDAADAALGYGFIGKQAEPVVSSYYSILN